MISLRAGCVGTAVQLAPQLRLAFSTSSGTSCKCSDLAEHITVEVMNKIALNCFRSKAGL